MQAQVRGCKNVLITISEWSHKRLIMLKKFEGHDLEKWAAFLYFQVRSDVEWRYYFWSRNVFFS